MALDPISVEAILRESQAPTAQVEAGGNSSVARVTVDGNVYAVKDYSHRSDGFSRQQREWEALTFLSDACPDLAPSPIWCSHDQPLAIHSWIAGSKPKWRSETVSAMADILTTLKDSFGRLPKDHGIPMAIDAVTHVSDLANQVSKRITAFEEIDNPGLRHLSRHIEARLQSLAPHLTERGPDRGVHVTLSPSDFGPHNMIHSFDEGAYRIIDLEFFGIDDVHKLIGDTVLHPQIFWTPPLLDQFLDDMRKVFNFNWDRLSEFLPFLSLKWAAIVSSRLARLGRSSEIDDSGNELSDLAFFYLDIAQVGDADGVLSRIVERGPDLEGTRK